MSVSWRTPAVSVITYMLFFQGHIMLRELLLNQLHISKNTFAQLIQAYSGTNFSGYINNKRLDYSIHLLKDYKRYTIEAVATDSGFSNVRSFYRIFREKYGMTPSEYRNTFEKE